MDRSTAYWHSDAAALPSASVDPWTFTGATVPSLQADGVRINVTSAEIATYGRQLWPADGVSSRRARDSFEAQALVRVASSTPGWSGTAPCVGIALHDGRRGLAVTVGASVALVHPSTGARIATLVSEFDPTRARWLRFRKEAGTRWVVEVDDVVVGTLPYDAAPTSTGVPRVAIGNLDSAATADVVLDELEVVLNGAAAPAWKVGGIRRQLPAAVGARWTAIARGVAKTIAAASETMVRELGAAQRLYGAGRLAETTYTAAGDVLPSSLSPAWTVNGSSKVSILRGRIAVVNLPTQAAVSIVAPFTGTLPAFAERYVRARVIIRSYVEDAQGRCGPYLVVDDGTKTIHAWAVHTADYQIAWVLADNAGSGALNEKGARFPVAHPGYARKGITPHDVELVVLGTTWVLLLVNGAVVHRAAYADFSAVASTSQRAGVGSIAITNTAEWERLQAGRRLTDLGDRPAFRLRMIERLFHLGGGERNDELDVWLRGGVAAIEARGRKSGILEEIKRLTGSQDSTVVLESTPADWYLETTWPDVTPIYLETSGQLRAVFAELVGGAPAFTRRRLAELVAWYVLPASVVELEYWACHAVLCDGNSSVPTAGTTRIPVVDVAGFTVGDVVHVRDWGNTTRETTTILAIGADYLDVVETLNTWVATDRVRLPLVRS